VLDKAEYSAFQYTLNSPIVSYRNLNYATTLPCENYNNKIGQF